MCGAGQGEGAHQAAQPRRQRREAPVDARVDALDQSVGARQGTRARQSRITRRTRKSSKGSCVKQRRWRLERGIEGEGWLAIFYTWEICGAYSRDAEALAVATSA
eukprot:6185242-Pleurochrysis_carterae.AAC.2